MEPGMVKDLTVFELENAYTEVQDTRVNLIKLKQLIHPRLAIRGINKEVCRICFN